MIRIFILSLLFFSSVASAEIADPGAISASLTSALNDAINYTRAGVLPAVIDFSYKLFYYFVAVGFVYYGAQYYASNGSLSFVAGDFVSFIIKASIPYLFLIHNSSVTSFIESFFYGFSGIMLGTSSPISGISDYPLMNMLSMPVEAILTSVDQLGTLFAKYDLDILGDLGSVFSYISTYIIVILISLAFALALLIMISQVVLGFILLAISLLFAPLFSVFSIGWIFSGLFTSWLSFTMSSGLILVVGSLMMKISEVMVNGFVSFDKFPPAKVKGASVIIQWESIVAMLLMTIVMLVLSRQIQTLSSQLGGGSVPNIGSTGDNRGKGAGAGGGGSSGGKGVKQTSGPSIGGGGGISTNPGGAMAKGAVSAAGTALSGVTSVSQAIAKTARTVAANSQGASGNGLARASQGLGKTLGQGVSSLRDTAKGAGANAKEAADQWSKPYGS